VNIELVRMRGEAWGMQVMIDSRGGDRINSGLTVEIKRARKVE
jgi:hypothetical protein